MIVKPHPRAAGLVNVIDAVNPYLILVSVIGLCLEFTELKHYVLTFNRIIDIIFLLDFVVRLFCFPVGKYLGKGFGWVDFLASLPGLLALLTYSPIFKIFKFVRVGRFFKLVRLLRFLRIFSFLRKMRANSPFIQTRIMKIGVSIVLVYIVGIAAMDVFFAGVLEDNLKSQWRAQYSLSQGDLEATVALDPQAVVAYLNDGQAFSGSGTAQTFAQLETLVFPNDQEFTFLIVLDFAKPGELVAVNASLTLPRSCLILRADNLVRSHDSMMLIMVLTLIGILVLLIFYMGATFARDMRVVQLIIDSLDAQDYTLLRQEAEARRDEDGSLEIDEDEDEIDALAKVVSRNSDALERGASYQAGSSSHSQGSADLGQRLDRIEALLSRRLDGGDFISRPALRESIKHTIQIMTPAIVDFIKKKQS